MINLIQHPAHSIYKVHDSKLSHCGQLITPASMYDIKATVELGMRWAADNGCFKRYEPDKIVSLLRYASGLPNCLFFVSPDVVQNHQKTLELFWQWESVIASYGYPVAFVIQDGATIETVPFDDCDAIFIAGGNPFRYTETVKEIIKEALKRKMWVHVGRVSTIQAIRYFSALGCHSFDSSGYSRFMKSKVAQHKKHYTNDRQLLLI